MNIRIRKMAVSDLEPLYKLLSNSKVMQYLEAPYTKEQTEQFLFRSGLSETPLIYAVEKDNDFIGYVIYHDYDSESVEIGWGLEPSFWGLGIASCLTSGMIAKARNSGKQVVIECVPEQKSSIRIAEKYGFQKCGIIDGLITYRLQRVLRACRSR